MRLPTDRQASLAASQLAYHREKLPWIRERMEENENLLRKRLGASGQDRIVLAGGFAVAIDERGVLLVSRLPAAGSRFEQLELPSTTATSPAESPQQAA